MTSHGYIIMIIVDSCMIWFDCDCIMQLKKSNHIVTNVCSRKKCYYFWWSPWLLSHKSVKLSWKWFIYFFFKSPRGQWVNCRPPCCYTVCVPIHPVVTTDPIILNRILCNHINEFRKKHAKERLPKWNKVSISRDNYFSIQMKAASL